jgi:hypothetical protein
VNSVTNIGTNALDGFIEDLTLIRIAPWWQSPWFVVLLLAVLICAVLAGCRWWMRRSHVAPATVAKASSMEPAHVSALRRLQALRQAMGEMSAYDFCTECSLILRQYIGARFDLAIVYQTTREFLEQAHTSPSLGLDHREKLGQYLHFADGVKFGRGDMSRDEMGRMIEYAEAFVKSSAAGGGEA